MTPFKSNMYTPRRNGLGKLPAVGFGFVGVFVQFQGCNLYIYIIFICHCSRTQTLHFYSMFRIGEFPEGLLGIFEKYHLSGLHMPAIACQQKQTGFAIYIYIQICAFPWVRCLRLAPFRLNIFGRGVGDVFLKRLDSKSRWTSVRPVRACWRMSIYLFTAW